jgi:V/A-type H+-transporting ATPase subunit C
LQEVENYNVSVILRAKAFFGAAFTPDDIQRLLIPYTYRISKSRLREMIEAKGIDLLLALYKQSGLDAGAGPANPDEFDASGGRVMYHHARRVLHLSSAPSAALAAFITLAKLERDNVVNVVEGVRYGLPPEKIRALLRF